MKSRVTFNAKTETADIHLYDPIGEWFGGATAKQFAADLKAAKDAKAIRVYINSPGGEVFEGLAIYNQLLRFKGRITTYIDGMAFSIASVIALAGDTVSMADNAQMMIHDPWGMAVGTAEEMRKAAGELDRTKSSLVAVYRNRTNLKDTEIESLMSAETFLTAAEAQKLGLVQDVTEAKRVAAIVTDRLPWLNSPQAREYVAAHGTVQAWEATADVRRKVQAMLTKTHGK